MRPARHWSLRALGGVGRTAGLVTVFAAATLGGLLLHVRFTLGRRLVASIVTTVLEREIMGRLVVEEIGSIEAGGIDGARVSVYDPAGTRVLYVTGVRARASLAGIARVIAAGGDIHLVIPRARAEHADVTILPDADGVPSLARAFLPRPSPSRLPSATRPVISVWLPEVELRAAHVRGNLPDLGELDADVGNIGGSVLAGSDRTSVQLKRYSLKVATPLRAQGTADTRIEIPSSTGKNLSVWSAFDGFVGDVQLDARGSIDGKDVRLDADLVRARPEALRALYPDWPVKDDVDLHVEAMGQPPTLTTAGHGEVGGGTVDVAGNLRLEKGVSLDLAVGATNIPLRAFVPAAPDARWSLSGRLLVEARPGQNVTGTFDAKTEPTRVLGLDVPPATVTGKIDGARVTGKALLRSPAFSSDVDFDVHPRERGGPVLANLVWSANVPEMQRVPWLSPVGSGQARWQARGQIIEGKLDARFDGYVDKYARPGVALERGHLSGTLRGPLDRLDLGASLEGQGLATGPVYFPEVNALARGPLTDLHLEVHSTPAGSDAPSLTAQASLARTPGGANLRDVEVSAERDGVALTGKVRAIEIADSGVTLRDVALNGAGAAITGSVVIAPGELRVHASGADIDLKKVGAVVAPRLPLEGRLAFDVDADLMGTSERGHARMKISGATFAGFSDLEAQFEADVNGRRLSAGAELKISDLGTLTATTVDASLAGSVLRSSSWKGASGRMQLDADVDLGRLRKTPLMLLLPPIEASGHVFARLLLAREELEAHQKHAGGATAVPPPDVDFLFWTDGLHVAYAEPTRIAQVRAPRRYSSDGVDVQLGFHLEGEGQHGALTARLIDDGGILAGLTVLADVPVESLLRTPRDIPERLMTLPMNAKLTLPLRAVGHYPEMFRPSDLEGEVEATGSLTGSLRSPAVDLAVRGHGIRPASEGVVFPVDADLQASYDGRKVSARLLARRPEGIVLDARTDVEAPLAGFFASEGQAGPRWVASGSADLHNFPIGSLSTLTGAQVSGLANGTMRWNGINRDPDVQAQLDFKDAKVDRAVFPHAVAVLRIAKGGVVASASVEQASGGGSATASARVKWTSPMIPDLDTGEPLDVYFAAHDLQAAVLYPLFLRGVFTYFDGRLNGTLHLHQEAVSGQSRQSVDGTFELQDGVFQIPEVGQEFRGATAKITMTKGGEVEVSNVSARGTTGRLTASGKMTVTGLSFASAEGEVRIANGEAVPLTLEGVSLGDAWGTLFLHAKRADTRSIKLDVDVPVFHADLPESSGRNVQALGDNPDVQVGVKTTSAFAPVLLAAPAAHRADDALNWKVTFFLGQDVRMRRGRGLEIVVGGQPVVDLTDEARVSGQVEMRSGNVEVFGKSFEIEHGVAKFEGDDPSNPYVSVTARWEAPDGTRIFADFVGPLRKGVLTLRSEPARAQSEILAILLFGGSTDSASDAAEQAQQAKKNETGEWVVGGAAVTTGVNRVLSSVTPLDITTRVTSDSQSPTPEVAIQISPKLTAEISYRTRPPGPLENQDRTLITLDWRFRRNWSIATTVGQQSTILDLIWRYRY